MYCQFPVKGKSFSAIDVAVHCKDDISLSLGDRKMLYLPHLHYYCGIPLSCWIGSHIISDVNVYIQSNSTGAFA